MTSIFLLEAEVRTLNDKIARLERKIKKIEENDREQSQVNMTIGEVVGRFESRIQNLENAGLHSDAVAR